MTTMTRIQAWLRITGKHFSPGGLKALTGVRLTAGEEPGALGRTGRYAGKPKPYGWGELASSPTPMLLTTPDEDFFSRAETLARAALGAGAEDLVFHVDVEYDRQCNLEFSQAFLAAVQRLGVPFTMTCYEAATGTPAENPR